MRLKPINPNWARSVTGRKRVSNTTKQVIDLNSIKAELFEGRSNRPVLLSPYMPFSISILRMENDSLRRASLLWCRQQQYTQMYSIMMAIIKSTIITVSQISAFIQANVNRTPKSIPISQVSGLSMVDFEPLASDCDNNALIKFIVNIFDSTKILFF